jgi:hypothetical protein
MKKAKKKPVKKAKKVVKKVVKKAVRKPVVSATEKVFRIIKQNKKGVETAKIKRITRYKPKKIWDAIHRLKKQRKVKSAQKGLYVAI